MMLSTTYGAYGLQRMDAIRLSPELQRNLDLSRKAFWRRWRAPVDPEKQQVNLTPQEEAGPNWWLWGGAGVATIASAWAIYHFFIKER
jgi:hypothetical protein